MKKALKIIIPIIIVVTIIFLGYFILKKASTNKTSITANEFKNSMESKDYSVHEVTSQFSDYNYIEKVYVAIDKTQNFQIEFYKLSDEENAINFFNLNKSIFLSLKANSSSETNVDLNNYSKYTLSSDGRYMVISRIDNTAIYVDCDSEYKDTVKDVLKDLGY